MRTLIHISDIHFGKTEARSLEGLIGTFLRIKPDLIIISGDLTQRAKVSEFKKAVDLLKEIKDAGMEYFVIPGNHDLEPFYKITRIFNRFRKYKEYISKDIDPTFKDSEIAIASIVTPRARKLKNGKINMHDVKRVTRWFGSVPEKLVKILVTHHPLDLPLERRKGKLAKRSHKGIKSLSKHYVDLYLSGHYHRSSCVHTGARYKIDNYSAVAVQAGTLSTRHRGEVQSFNVIKIDKPSLLIETYLWDKEMGHFVKSTNKSFVCASNVWQMHV